MPSAQVRTDDNQGAPGVSAGRASHAGSSCAARPGDVLFVTHAGATRRAGIGLRRAAVLARMLGGRLFAACALPRGLRHNILFPHWNIADAQASLGGHFDAAIGLRAVWDAALPRPLPQQRLIFREGEVMSVAASAARELDAAAVVLPGDCDGKLAAKLACTARVPVLVARRPRSGGSIVGATDMADPRFPVLLRTGELAEQAEGRAAVVHNVPPHPAFVPCSLNLIGRIGVVPGEEVIAGCEERLRALVRSLGVEAEAVIASRHSTADAIVQVAREEDADLVIVGTHPRSWLRRALWPSTAERVIDQTDRSVLVLPLLRRSAVDVEEGGAAGIEIPWAA